MIRYTLQTSSRDYCTDGDAIDLSIALDFDGPQPGFYGADAATARPMHSGEFIGDTRLGGSCNAEHVDIVTHCNGTHTECAGHITHERVWINKLVSAPFYTCRVLSVATTVATDTEEQGGPVRKKLDRLITRRALKEAAGQHQTESSALVIRTLPNPAQKTTRNYEAEDAPYFSVEAMQWIVDNEIEHLLVDTPSVDRLVDGGRLTAHRIFWGVKPGSRSIDDVARPAATITELVFIPDCVADGMYLLNLQIAPFMSDAAPSRPLLYRVLP